MSRQKELAGTDIGSLFAKAGLGLLGESGTRVVFRSNVTPDITVDISGLMRVKASEIELDPSTSAGTTPADQGVVVPANPDAEEVPVSSADTKLLKFIRPEVALNVLGNRVGYAPYGRPRRSTAIAFVFAIVASILIGAKIAWVVCKKV